MIRVYKGIAELNNEEEEAHRVSIGGDSDSVSDLFDQSRSIIINYCSEHHERGKIIQIVCTLI